MKLSTPRNPRLFSLHHCGFVRGLYRLLIAGRGLDPLGTSAFKGRNNIAHGLLGFVWFFLLGLRGTSCVFAHRLAFNDGVSDLRGEATNRAKRSIITGNDVID